MTGKRVLLIFALAVIGCASVSSRNDSQKPKTLGELAGGDGTMPQGELMTLAQGFRLGELFVSGREVFAVSRADGPLTESQPRSESAAKEIVSKAIFGEDQSAIANLLALPHDVQWWPSADGRSCYTLFGAVPPQTAEHDRLLATLPGRHLRTETEALAQAPTAPAAPPKPVAPIASPPPAAPAPEPIPVIAQQPQAPDEPPQEGLGETDGVYQRDGFICGTASVKMSDVDERLSAHKAAAAILHQIWTKRGLRPFGNNPDALVRQADMLKWRKGAGLVQALVCVYPNTINKNLPPIAAN